MRSPKGRDVETLDGDAGAILERGRAITKLGNEMASSATFLKSLAEQASGMKGDAVKKLEEVVGDTHEELSRAAKLYKPTGPVLVTYANELAEAQPLISTAVSACKSALADYQAAPGYMDGARPPRIGLPPLTDEAKAAQKEQDEENAETDGKKQALWEDYQAELRAFDRHVDTWEDAFDKAAEDIEDAFDGKIKDGFWDNVDGFVAGVVKVLQVVGTIVAIAAIIIGGPIIAAIGAVIAVATLALVIYQFIRDDASGWDLALAIVGVIPFGSAGKLFQGKAGLVEFAGDAFSAFKPSTWSAAAGQLRNLGTISTFAGGGFRGFAAAGRNFLTMNNPAGVGDIMTRLLFGKDTKGLSGLAEAMGGSANGWCSSTTLSAAWDFTHTVIGGSIKLTDKIANWTGNGDQSVLKKVPLLGAVL